MSSGSIPDPHRWMDVACTCTFPTWAHEDHCKRGQAIRDYCDEGIRRERDVNDQPDTTAPQPDESGRPVRRSAAADRIANDLIVRRGMSYADATRYCEEQAAPWLEVARELGRHQPTSAFPEEAPADKVIATIPLDGGDYKEGVYAWQVRSSYGVVKVWSSRDGCMLATNSTRARLIARELGEAIEDAASSVDRASEGGQR